MLRAFIALALAAAVPTGLTLAAIPILTATETAQLDEVMRRGRLIYLYDQAAWHTTDVVVKKVKDPAKLGLAGWVVTPHEKGWQVTYFGRDDKGPFGVYSAVWTGQGKTVVDAKPLARGTESALSVEQTRLANALSSVVGSAVMRCANRPMNSVVLPARSPGEADSVYHMTPITSSNALPFGGHHRFDVKDGKVVSTRGFTRGCIDIPSLSGDQAKKAAGLVVTHLLDPIPTEIHVFFAMMHPKPVFVATEMNKRIWKIENKAGQPRYQLQDADKFQGIF